MSLRITEVQINFIKPTNGLVGFASLVINNDIYLSSIAIHRKLYKDEYRITYPTKEVSDQKSINIFHPINKKASEDIEKAIIDKLKEVMSKGNNDRYNSYDIAKR